MKAVVALLLGVTSGFTEVDQNPYGKLVMAEAWKQEITYDWNNLNHALAFDNWKKEFGKSYDNTESEASAFLTFMENWKLINEHNIAEAAGEHTFKMGVNQFRLIGRRLPAVHPRPHRLVYGHAHCAGTRGHRGGDAPDGRARLD